MSAVGNSHTYSKCSTHNISNNYDIINLSTKPDQTHKQDIP